MLITKVVDLIDAYFFGKVWIGTSEAACSGQRHKGQRSETVAVVMEVIYGWDFLKTCHVLLGTLLFTVT